MESKRVLVVDDDGDAVAFVQAALAPIGMTVISAEDGESGLELAKSERPDLVILDVFMPKKLGFHSLLDFKSAPETRDIPVVMLTAVSARVGMSYSADDVGEYFGVQPDVFLDKPVEPGKLQSVVQELLGQ